MSQYSFSSESVSPGHPDKVADQVADAILDAALSQDAQARVACEVLVKNSLVLLAGEMSTTAWVDIEQVVSDVVHRIGYTKDSYGFDAACLSILNAIGRQSEDIAQGILHDTPQQQGAGDQGLMFGYACTETDQYMPAPIQYAHALMREHNRVLQDGAIAWLGPDAKAQVEVVYDNHLPVAIASVVLSTQHTADVGLATVREWVRDELVLRVLPAELYKKETKVLINPAGNFIRGGPVADCGLTGRKIIVDTYGGMARHGGGAFSGKDPSKVDRSAAYMARYIAKHVVAAGWAARCEVRLAYAIGRAEPTSVGIDTFGSAQKDNSWLVERIRDTFSLTPYGIIEYLRLKQPIYQPTAALGHFGRDDITAPWESLDALDRVKAW